MHIKIAITGKMRAGKDTVYSILKEELELELNNFNNYTDGVFITKQHTFGGQLKYFAELLFPEHFVAGGKPRQLFQDFGQSMRQIDEDVWVKKVDQEIQNKLKSTYADVHISYITDLRQPNEYEYCKENGFFILRVNATDEVRLARMMADGDNFTKEHLHHETETYVDGYEVDYDINNNFTTQNGLEELRKEVKQLVKIILEENNNNENEKKKGFFK